MNDERIEKLPKVHGYVHTLTFFNGNRWSLHDKVGELLGSGRIRQMSIALVGNDWQLSWVDPVPPNVIQLAEGVDPS